MSDAEAVPGTAQLTAGESRRGVWALLGGFAIVALLLHFILISRVRIFHDELCFVSVAGTCAGAEAAAC
jgi:hypothetical protein